MRTLFVTAFIAVYFCMNLVAFAGFFGSGGFSSGFFGNSSEITPLTILSGQDFYWFDGDNGTTTDVGVTKWDTINTTNFYLDKLSDANEPSLESSCINGHSCLETDGNDSMDGVAISASGDLDPSESSNKLAVYMVVNPVNSGTTAVYANWSIDASSTGAQLIWVGSGTMRFRVQDSTSNGVNFPITANKTESYQTGWQVFSGIYDGTTAKEYRNGTEIATHTGTGGLYSGGTWNRFYIFKEASSTITFPMGSGSQIAGLLIIKGGLTAQQKSDLDAYYGTWTGLY